METKFKQPRTRMPLKEWLYDQAKERKITYEHAFRLYRQGFFKDVQFEHVNCRVINVILP